MKGFIFFVILFSHFSAFNQNIPAEESGIVELMGITKKLSDAKDIGVIDELLMRKKQHEDEEREKSQMMTANEKENNNNDPALQKTGEITETEITIVSNWEGLKSKYLRSDNNIAVGPNHVVQMVNSPAYSSYIRIWNKTGGLIVSKATMYDLTGHTDYGDPNIIYDEKADRWVISFLFSGVEPKLIVMASVTGDPAGEWYYYNFTTTGGFPDYEKLCVWGNSYVITTAQANPNVYVLNREHVLNGIGASPVLKFPVPKFKNIGWQAASPVQETGSLIMPDDEPAVIWRVFDNWWHPPYSMVDQLELFELNINWDDPGASFMTGPIALPIETYNSDLCGINSNECLEQPGTDVKLWPLSNFITDKSKYINFGDYQSIVGVHVCRVNAEGTAGQRWYELRKYPGGEWYIYQQGTYSPTGDHRFIGSISINEEGSIALGYNITSSTVYPGMRVTGRALCDPLNMMTAPETVSKEGTASNHSLDYGDYNSLVTDPVDGSFWFSAQYNVTNKWSSNVVHFTINSCPEEKGITNEHPVLSELQLSPVPANEQLTISFLSSFQTNGPIQIMDATGRQVIRMNFSAGAGQNTITFDISHLPPGYYLIRLGDGTYPLNGKFVIER